LNSINTKEFEDLEIKEELPIALSVELME